MAHNRKMKKKKRDGKSAWFFFVLFCVSICYSKRWKRQSKSEAGKVQSRLQTPDPRRVLQSCPLKKEVFVMEQRDGVDHDTRDNNMFMET